VSRPAASGREDPLQCDGPALDPHACSEIVQLKLERGEIGVRDGCVFRIPRSEMIAVELDQPFIGELDEDIVIGLARR
jgi:hypothetical protein